MTQVMNPPSFGLSVPSSRQDVISALLNEYGTSFGQTEPAWSPLPTSKELPPPPPGSEEKPLPPAMSMRFQLRVDEPDSYDDRRKNSIETPSKIISRSMTRQSKPPSLKLLASNGSTALVPTSPAPPASQTLQAPQAPPKDQPSYPPRSQSLQDRPLPPPPPEKSELRKSVRRDSGSTMGQPQSKTSRKDSKGPDDLHETLKQKEVGPEDRTPKIARKPVPATTFPKRFASLADLKNGPRGKLAAAAAAASKAIGSNPDADLDSSGNTSVSSEQPTSAFERVSKSSQLSTIERVSKASQRSAPEREIPSQSMSTTRRDQLPPTPDDLPAPVDNTKKIGLPGPPRRIYPGLPSNPRRSKTQTQEAPAPLRNSQGKSDGGFGVVKPSEPEFSAPVALPRPMVITPVPTPQLKERESLKQEEQIVLQQEDSTNMPTASTQSSKSPTRIAEAEIAQPPPPPPMKESSVPQPGEKGLPQQPPPTQTLASTIAAALKEPESPVSPLSDYGDLAQRPFSYEQKIVPQVQPQPQSGPGWSQQVQQQAQQEIQQPPQQQTLQQTQQPQQPKEAQPSIQPPQPLPSQQRATSAQPPLPRPSSTSPTTIRFPLAAPSPSTFVPLTVQPLTQPPAPLLPSHYNCYTAHAHFAISTPRSQPPSCMVCGMSTPGTVRATCSWCLLVVCGACREELMQVPGRKLEVLVARKKGGMRQG